MNEFDVKKIWPEWGAAHILREGAFGKIYRIETTENGQVIRSFARVVEMPPNRQMADDALEKGVSEFQLRQYFEKIRADMETEMGKCSSLVSPYLIRPESIQFRDNPDYPGWTAFIRTPAYTPLFEYIRQNGAMNRAQTVRMGVEICKGIAVLTNNGLVHGDVNPGTVYVYDGRFMIGDFGLRRSLEKAGSRLFKTPYGEFDSPEVVAVGQSDVTSDVYSAALVMAYAMNGGLLPTDSTLDSVRDMTPALAEIIRKATSVDNRQRYSSTMELLGELGKIDVSEPKHAHTAPQGENENEKPKKGGFFNKLVSWIKSDEDDWDEKEPEKTESEPAEPEYIKPERQEERENSAAAEPEEKEEPAGPEFTGNVFEDGGRIEEKPGKNEDAEFVPDKSFADFDVDSIISEMNPDGKTAEETVEEVYVDGEAEAESEELGREMASEAVEVEYVEVPDSQEKEDKEPGTDIFDSVVNAVKGIVDRAEEKKEDKALTPDAKAQEKEPEEPEESESAEQPHEGTPEAAAPDGEIAAEEEPAPSGSAEAQPEKEAGAEEPVPEKADLEEIYAAGQKEEAAGSESVPEEKEEPEKEEEFDFSPDPDAKQKADPVAEQEADIQLSSFLNRILEETGLQDDAPKSQIIDPDETKVWRKDKKKKTDAAKQENAPAEKEQPETAPVKSEEVQQEAENSAEGETDAESETAGAPAEEDRPSLAAKPAEIEKEVSAMLKNILEETGIDSADGSKKNEISENEEPEAADAGLEEYSAVRVAGKKKRKGAATVLIVLVLAAAIAAVMLLTKPWIPREVTDGSSVTQTETASPSENGSACFEDGNTVIL